MQIYAEKAPKYVWRLGSPCPDPHRGSLCAPPGPEPLAAMGGLLLRGGKEGEGPIFKRDGRGKGKVFPYSLPSVGPGADPGVQAVSPQVT